MQNKPSDLHNQQGISVVVPVYRGQETLPDLVARLVPVLSGLTENYEIVLVNDGSPDRSWDVICSLQEKVPSINGVCLKRNYGQHNATLCGVRVARYPVIVTMDDDLQHPPEEIPLLVGKLNEGYDVIYGVPRKLPHAWWRNQMSRFTKRMLAKLMGLPTVRDVSAFRAFRSHLRDAFVDFRNPNVILDVLLAWGTTRFSTVMVDEDQRQIGQSNYDFLKLVNVAMVVLTGFSTAPLRFASTLGFLFTIFGVIIFLYVVWIYLFLGSIPGFPFLASIIALFSGIQLFSLGIIGEYLARVFDRSIDRPPYVIGETTAAPSNLSELS